MRNGRCSVREPSPPSPSLWTNGRGGLAKSTGFAAFTAFRAAVQRNRHSGLTVRGLRQPLHRSFNRRCTSSAVVLDAKTATVRTGRTSGHERGELASRGHLTDHSAAGSRCRASASVIRCRETWTLPLSDRTRHFQSVSVFMRQRSAPLAHGMVVQAHTGYRGASMGECRDETYRNHRIAAEATQTPAGWYWSYLIDGRVQRVSKIRLLPSAETALVQALAAARTRIDELERTGWR